jgi:hypothetical protein
MNIIRKEVKTIAAALCVSTLCGLSSAPMQAKSSVPASYSSTYSALDKAVDNFVTSLDCRKDASNPKLGTILYSANGEQGTTILKPQTMTAIQAEIGRCQSLGMKAVTVRVPFPLGCQQFWSNNMQGASNPQAVMAVYSAVVQKCHAAGMHVHVSAAPSFSYNGNQFADTAQNFAINLTASQYQTAFAEHISNIASLVQPDGIGITSGPSGDLNWTSQMVYSAPSSLQDFVQVMVNKVSAANAKSKARTYVTAGSGSTEFNNAFAKVNGLAAIELSIGFSGKNELQNAITFADSAHAAGKAVIVTSAWLTKYGIGTPPYEGIGAGQGLIEGARSSYSFWEPLDCKFLSAMKKFARVESTAIITVGSPQELFAYNDYNSVANDSDPDVVTLEGKAAYQAIMQGEFSSAGLRLGELNF